ncbi:DUF7661 family protein [Achromobacter xylosoxidans]
MGRVSGRGGQAGARRGIVIPADLPEDELSTYLDDLYHELARPGDMVTRLS